MARLDARQIQKRSTVPGALPTVPPSNNHLDGSWTVNDIYECELFFNIPDNKVYTRFGVTIVELMSPGADTEAVCQFEVINPEIISSGGIEIWEFDNTLFDKYAQCALYDESTDLRLTAVANKVTDTKITFIFYTGIDIPAGSYRCSIQGKQKIAPIEEGFTYTFPFTLS